MQGVQHHKGRSPYADRLVMRMGFEFRMKKKPKTKGITSAQREVNIEIIRMFDRHKSALLKQR
jgi:hypothetical protein